METKESRPQPRATTALPSKSPEVVGPLIGLIYTALFILYVVIQYSFVPGGPPPFIPILTIFVLAFLGAAVGVWRRSRVGYVAAAVISGVFLIAEGSRGGFETWSNPANTLDFVGVVSVYPALAVALVYIVLGLRTMWRKRASEMRTATLPRSGVIGLVAVGFVLGGLVVGLLAGATQTRLLASSGGPADITLVLGAVSPNNAEFYSPSTFQAKVDQTVTWANRDSASHTVTSTTGAFDSGNMDVGATWSYTFSQAGTFEYFCVYHPWMKGSVVVTG